MANSESEFSDYSSDSSESDDAPYRLLFFTDYDFLLDFVVFFAVALVFFGASFSIFFTAPLFNLIFLEASGITSLVSSFIERVTCDRDRFFRISFYSGTGSETGGNFLFLRVICI